ncbi:hypothetical protein [Okeania sp. SIO2B3]|uniref:hypothetical protein n=1 Tax=Okeania sp. SIO2B3 TaxID=2607784 RepID=UPI0013C08738|nr:hypothetical protein [Okeania sp. SIO2B3]NET43687.1 hypothetical protein [Okeania sp. SIO2B3]
MAIDRIFTEFFCRSILFNQLAFESKNGGGFSISSSDNIESVLIVDDLFYLFYFFWRILWP